MLVKIFQTFFSFIGSLCQHLLIMLNHNLTDAGTYNQQVCLIFILLEFLEPCFLNKFVDFVGQLLLKLTQRQSPKIRDFSQIIFAKQR